MIWCDQVKSCTALLTAVVLIVRGYIMGLVFLNCVSAGFARVCEFDKRLSFVQQRFRLISLLCHAPSCDNSGRLLI